MAVNLLFIVNDSLNKLKTKPQTEITPDTKKQKGTDFRLEDPSSWKHSVTSSQASECVMLELLWSIRVGQKPAPGGPVMFKVRVIETLKAAVGLRYLGSISSTLSIAHLQQACS